MFQKLQVLAQTTYSRWFNQFEYPNADKELVLNKELGKEIPKNWSVKKLQDCVEHITTGLNPRDNFVLNNGNISYITVKNLTFDSVLDLSTYDTINSETKYLINKRSKTDVKDILYASIAPLGRCYLIQEEPKSYEINESVFSIRANKNIISPEYLYLLLKDDYFNTRALNSSMGSIFKGIRISVLNDFDIIVPDNKTMKNFSNIVSKYLYQLHIINKETAELVRLKEKLLPLLINGQLNI